VENLETTTTEQQDKQAYHTQMIDFLMEITQTILAISLTSATIYISIKGIASEELSNAFFLIIGFYFGKSVQQKSSNVLTKAQAL
jgi:hypothetical protein